ncbi:hypothetical protein PR048_030423 [Dryococelus australis]|uniref:Mutator-like transposase domain-containing protein n=1 Tax=Dryococelus australis TaxID=614101 RepID=A0ABQ9G8Y3_9NEOP|nr:hypothetical protein PR048_030423 [Dryococelus australis]
MCHITEPISTELPSKDATTVNVNASAVSGMIATGRGYSQLEEICASLNMPCISRNTWDIYHNTLYKDIYKTAWDLMEEAAGEEAKLAIKGGEVTRIEVHLS